MQSFQSNRRYGINTVGGKKEAGLRSFHLEREILQLSAAFDLKHHRIARFKVAHSGLKL
jgi:hypothetical protein